MSDAMKALLNLRSLRALSREYTLEQLEEALDKLTTVVTERSDAEAEEQAKENERNEKLAQYREMLLADGIDPEELLASLAKAPKTKRASRPAKYKFIDENGDEKTWTGQGRTPSALKKALDDGQALEEFEI
ncbi:transcriptional regulator [Photobacterium iliopiscarium]|jgi:DNA-binding protein H-NS|uniref:DNA-binding protein n=1 Tax=Photobacterium iliopiscarium TaxID=56192 RepID=A0A0D8PD43_9GAMM|nr:H-NS family nucleoid-associated regulatory protein [Photobacterium iliopiscarium]KJG14964.1 transcriptional regulator [Photobacterium iliopiscarium]KJG21839.1 transcriptional regulator [Photobacterium iliopiscarium]MCD9467147.1 transcriptional regulator [Photobacterium iliopiscarium]MCD9487094.1 H-NS histone family protein [Photobacterium iliopiscarium]MCF2243666.1 H-NS histone family protein [Photobacterium iliopiscarium]